MNKRQNDILEKLNKTGAIDIEEEAVRFDVSTMTIRRDIKLLVERGVAIRVNNGAIPATNDPLQLFINSKPSINQKFIARKAVELIPEGKTVMLSTGNTTLEVARQLAVSGKELSVFTNSLPIAATLFQTPVHVILTGGMLRSNSLDLVGPVTEKNIDEYYIDILISGCDGAIADEGFFTKDMNLAEMERKSVEKSKKIIIVTESKKFDNPAFVKFAKTEEVSTLITDSGLSGSDRKSLRKSGLEVFCC